MSTFINLFDENIQIHQTPKNLKSNFSKQKLNKNGLFTKFSFLLPTNKTKETKTCGPRNRRNSAAQGHTL